MAKSMNMDKMQLTRLLKSNLKKRLIIILCLIVLLPSMSTALSENSSISPSRSPPPEEPINTQKVANTFRSVQGDWQSLNLWNDNKELYAVAVGDVDETHPGDEIVVAGESNKVTVVYGYGNSWVAETAYEDEWYITSIAIGDVYPHHSGNEIVIVGWSAYVTLIYKSVETNKWVSEVLFQDTDWLYDVAIGDLDPTHDGNEIVWSGDPRILRMLSYSEDTKSWESKNLWGSPSSLTPADINVITIGDFNATHPGNECAVAGVLVHKINLTEVFYNYSTGKWNVHDMGKLEKDPLEMVAGDFYSGHSGDELALVSIQRNVMMIYQNTENNEWVKDKLWQDIESIRDIEIFDIIPEHVGNELVIAGYSNSATILMENQKKPNGWEDSTIYTAAGTNLNGVSIGEFDAFHSGMEIAIIQSVGKLYKLQYKTSGFNLLTPQHQYMTPAGNSISVPIIVNQEGDYSEPVNLIVNNESELSKLGIEAEFNSTQSTPPALAFLKLSISDTTQPDDYEISILGESKEFPDGRYLNFTLSVLPSETPAFKFTISPHIGSVVADFSKNFQLITDKTNNWNDEVSLNIRYLPPGVAYSFNKRKIKPPENSQLTLTTSSATPVGKHFIMVTGTSQQSASLKYTDVIVLDVLEPEPDFELKVEPTEVELRINGTSNFIIYGFSLFGFDEEITLSFSGLPDGVSVILSPESFVPTGNSTIVLRSTKKTDLKIYNISVIGTSTITGIQRNKYFNIQLLPEAPGFNISLELTDELLVFVGDMISLELSIRPIAGFTGEINITIQGLEGTMYWNDEISPIFIDKDKTVFINISGLTEPGKYELMVQVSDDNQTNDLGLPLEILPKIESDDESNIYETIILIIILVIVLIVILVVLSKLSSRATAKKKKKEDKDENLKTDEKNNEK